MKKLFPILVPVFLSVFFLSSCKVGCDAEQVISTNLAGLLASQLQCSNQAAIQASITEVLGSVNFCAIPDRKTGSVATVVCPLLASALATFVGTQIPASWGCTNASQPVANIVTSACDLLPF